MGKKYKAISTIVTKKPRTKYNSETREKRYVIIDTESGEIVDDAQGYGYKTAQKAYAGWSYKNRDKSKDKEKAGTEYDSETREKRYVIIDTESGEIVDDAQGYGYKTAQKAYAGWSYKNRDKSKDKEKAEKERIIARWMLSLSKICWKRTAIRICRFLLEIY